MKAFEYAVDVRWDDASGRGTADYASYARQWRAVAPGKPAVVGSADPAFRGDRRLVDPEELLVMALGTCHMLSYLALCARRHVRVVAYRDRATGVMRADHAGGQFEEVVLHPDVVIAGGDDLELARALHGDAHASCYIARSVSFPVRHVATVVHGAAVVPGERVDLGVRLASRSLAELCATLGAAGVSIEGGGAFGDVAHFLVADAGAARTALAGWDVTVRDVVTHRLDQDRPGALAAALAALAAAGVAIEAQYSDHDHQLILVVDDAERARACLA